MVGFIYMLLTWIGTKTLHILEERVAISGYTR
jgi:hypothetical protein